MDMYNWFINASQEEEYWAYRPTFSKEQCEEIIKLGTSLHLQEGKAVMENPNDTSVRKSRVSWIKSSDQNNHWIFRECSSLILELNQKYFKYDLLYLEGLQFTEYNGNVNDPAFYAKHTDTMFRNNGSRKLSFSVLLSDEDSFDGGDLMLHYAKDPVTGLRKQGNAVAFPSHMLHEVTPVTRGIRYSLVGWVVGPRFR